MAAVVLAFQAPKPQPQRPWQNHELAELYRAVDILGRAGLAISTDMGVSDEGDPWFAFCRADTGDVIVHCARISGVFVASSIAVSQTFRGGNFREVIDSIVRYQPLGIPVAATNSQLFLHPLMVLAAFVATALLCSKNADAHDLHAAIVSLTPAEPVTDHKGFAALKAAIGQFLDTGSHIDADLSKSSNAVAANAEPIPLAAFMAAALTIIKPSFDAVVQTLGATDSVAIMLADHVHATPQPIASSVLLNTDQDTAIMRSDAIASAMAATMVTAADWTKLGDLSLNFQPILLSDHTIPNPPTDAGAALLGAASGNSERVLLAPQFDHFVLHHVQTPAGAVIATTAVSVATTINADQASAATMTQAQPGLIHQVAADFGIVSSIALSVFLGPPEAQLLPTDALTLILQSPTHADDAATPQVLANLLADKALTPSPANTLPPVIAPPGGDAGNGATVSGTDAGSGTGVSSAVAQALADLSPSAATPATIVLAADPMKGLAQLANYAASNHPITGALMPAQDLMAGIAAYTSQTAHSATLVVFDSDSVKLPFFEFIKGVIFVDDHELGINPSSAALANAVSVDLGSGAADGSMKLLGVIDSSQLHFVSA